MKLRGRSVDRRPAWIDSITKEEAGFAATKCTKSVKSVKSVKGSGKENRRPAIKAAAVGMAGAKFKCGPKCKGETVMQRGSANSRKKAVRPASARVSSTRPERVPSYVGAQAVRVQRKYVELLKVHEQWMAGLQAVQGNTTHR